MEFKGCATKVIAQQGVAHMRRDSLLVVLCCIGVWTLSTRVATAQIAATSTVRGEVADSSGAALPGVSVTATLRRSEGVVLVRVVAALSDCRRGSSARRHKRLPELEPVAFGVDGPAEAADPVHDLDTLVDLDPRLPQLRQHDQLTSRSRSVDHRQSLTHCVVVQHQQELLGLAKGQ